MIPKYKPEDIVIVRSWEEMKIWFNENNEAYYHSYGIFEEDQFYVDKRTISLLNNNLDQLYKIVEIKERRNFNCYTIQELTDDKEHWPRRFNVCEEMIDRPTPNILEQITVKDINQYCEKQCLAKVCEDWLSEESCLLYRWKKK